ncbi:hypothetical protein C4D60_Mb04t16610 [Musa balbisiana]|uniref:Uncharacterized protein n=1 Tax=Musa balbisiana TaxID=52838 RepID=A0A4S8KCH6_MUSBA|nr:hypothetical protein C4D60_Mb04t16610 [Musa balbisiana]
MMFSINYDTQRWWRPLLLYACFSILIIYIYQLPVVFPSMFLVFADFVGLYKINRRSDCSELCSAVSLLIYYFMDFISLQPSFAYSYIFGAKFRFYSPLLKQKIGIFFGECVLEQFGFYNLAVRSDGVDKSHNLMG